MLYSIEYKVIRNPFNGKYNVLMLREDGIVELMGEFITKLEALKVINTCNIVMNKVLRELEIL